MCDRWAQLPTMRDFWKKKYEGHWWSLIGRIWLICFKMSVAEMFTQYAKLYIHQPVVELAGSNFNGTKFRCPNIWGKYGIKYE